MFTWLWKNFGIDKIYHFCVCLAIAFVGGLLAVLLGCESRAVVVWAAMYAAVGAGLCKEFTDWQHGCKPSWGDIVADVLGAVIGTVAAVLVTVG